MRYLLILVMLTTLSLASCGSSEQPADTLSEAAISSEPAQVETDDMTGSGQEDSSTEEEMNEGQE